MSKQSPKFLERGYRPTSGPSVNTANPPKGGSGVPPKYPVNYPEQSPSSRTQK